MPSLLQRWNHHRQRRRLRRSAAKDATPAGTLALCELLRQRGAGEELLMTLHAGLERFPHSQDLQDLHHEAQTLYGAAHLKVLEYRLDLRASVENYMALVRAQLDLRRLDEARQTSRQMVRSHRRSLEALLLYGRVHQVRFFEDHHREDGERALKAFRKASEMDAGAFEPRLQLAETYAHIGATSQAMFHLLLALDLDPDDARATQLYQELRHLPFERRKEADLLWESEVNDASQVHSKSRPADVGYLKEMDGGLCRLSQLEGVRRAALCHRGVELVAKDGRSLRLASREKDPFLALAIGFRKAASTCTKRVGMGRFQQADLSMDRGRVLAIAAGPTVLMLAIAGDPDVDHIAREARNHLASWTASHHRALEWVH